jgi:hypothetical protein
MLIAENLGVVLVYIEVFNGKQSVILAFYNHPTGDF